MAYRGKRIRKIKENLNSLTVYSLDEAVNLVKQNATAKFDETIEVIMNLNVDIRKADQTVRGLVDLPNGTGKNLKVAVFARGDKAAEAQQAGADLVGAEDLAEQIQKGELGFDKCVATPDMMGIVGRVAKILGPKGLMPNPKLGTVTVNVSSVIKAIKSGGQIEYRAEKAGIVHAGVGKASFSPQALKENVKTFVQTIMKARPSGAKGGFVKKVSLGSTMGPSLKLNLEDL